MTSILASFDFGNFTENIGLILVSAAVGFGFGLVAKPLFAAIKGFRGK